MSKIEAFTERADIVEDADSVGGRELVKEFRDAYDQGGAAPLDYTTWLPFAAKTYHISPDINDYVLSVTPICPADIPNRNGVAFPIQELKMFAPPPSNRMVYKCWAGCPVHREHRNEHVEEAYGVVLDASLHKIKMYGGGELWKVMGLVATDKKKHPDTATRVLRKDVETYSMGCLSDYLSCSLCGTPVRYDKNNKLVSCCSHIDPEANLIFYPYKDQYGQKHAVYQNVHGIQPFELSIVEDPAWPIALGDTLLQM